MEIYLRVALGGDADVDTDRGGPADEHDIAVRVEPSHTVRAVADAIAGFIELDLPLGFPVSLASVGPIADELTMGEAGILSGETIVLGAAAHPPGPEPVRRTLAVASGPDAGQELALGPGTWTVGRADGCDLPLTDPLVSRRHLKVTVAEDDSVAVESLVTDRNEVRTAGHTVTGPEPLAVDQPLRVGATTLVVRRSLPARGTRVDAFGQIPFHRAPYFPTPVQPVVVEAISDLPVRPVASRFAYLSALIPVLMGVSFALLFDSPRYLMFAVFSPVMLIGNYIEQRRRSGRTFAESVERFEQDLDRKAIEVRRAMASERDRRFAAAPDVSTLRDRAQTRAVELWVRDRDAHDFLHLRVGIGDVPAALRVEHADRGDGEYRAQVIEAYGETDIVTDVPIGVDLTELGVVGIVGPSTETTALASSLAVQAACLHSPEDVVILAALAPRRGVIDWLKWVPHGRASSSPLGCPHLVSSKTAADALLAELVAEATRRLAASSGPPPSPWLVVVLDRLLEPDAAMVSRLLDACPQAGISVIWLSEAIERVPRQAKAVVACEPARSGRMSQLSFTDPDRPDHDLDHDRIGPELAAAAGRALAPVRDASSANATTAIPRVVPLFTAFGIEAVDADWVARQWKTERGYSLPGPIGYTDAGPLVLDMVEHGPHGLIGGTSGAGKSELVMAMVAGLIAYNPPTRVNLLFIDYKGGAASDRFIHAPHTVGYVTNLDGLLAMRALTSLRAELNRRMNLLKGKAKDLEEMLDKHPDEAPPSLVIVVDEFATLVNEIPDFVTGIVDIAQRGRSLGIHLILATQRPSGSVNDNIKANTNLRISLRVLDGGESSSVIGSPDAAAIPAPLKGRGYARLGAGDLVAFQSAWAGAPLLAESGPPPVGVAVFGPNPPTTAGDFWTGDDRPEKAGDGRPADTGPARTQVEALLGAVTEAAGRLGLPSGRPPWLESLPPMIPVDEVRAEIQARTGGRGDGRPTEPGVEIAFGMIDDPAAQAQYPAVIDLAKAGGLLVAGAGGSGKSTVLVTAAVSAALDDSARGGGRLTIFAIDFASRELGGLTRLPQCGAVATSDDFEAVTRIIALLHGELERRRQAQAEAVLRAEAAPSAPTVLLLIDGMDALVQAMEQSPGAGGLADHHAQLTKLVTDGRQVGIYPIMTASRYAAIRASVSAAVSGRLTLRQTDAQGYAEAGIGAAEAKDLDLGPGQGFYNGRMLVQVASPTAVGDGPGRSDVDTEHRRREQLVELAGSLRGSVDPRLVTSPLPRVIGMLPSPDPRRPVIGLADMTGAPFALDLTFENLSIVGDPRSGRSTALATIGCQVAGAGGDVWVVASPGSPLRELSGVARSCFTDGEARQRFLDELAGEAAEPTDRWPILLLDDYDLIPEADRATTQALETLLGLVRYAAAGPKPRGFTSHPISQAVRTCRSLVHLRPHDAREAHEVTGGPVAWRPGVPMVEGRGYVVVDRLPTMVQFASPFITP